MSKKPTPERSYSNQPERIYDDTYEGKRYTYGCRNRPPGYAAIPNNWICDSQRDNPRFRHGTIQYAVPLTDWELYSYELEPAEVEG